jgi:hypothetical protein
VSICELLEIARAGIKLSRFDPNDWAKRHYVRSSAVRCVHHQTDVDKMIPMRRGGDYSQIYIQDKHTTESNPHENTCIRRDHEDFRTEDEKPWIAITLDMGADLPDDRPLKVDVDVGSSHCKRGKGSRSASPTSRSTCWRIYAVGKTKKTYPFLAATEFPLEIIFHDLLTQEFQLSPLEVELQPLQDKFEFGWSTYDRHMEWERQ